MAANGLENKTSEMEIRSALASRNIRTKIGPDRKQGCWRPFVPEDGICCEIFTASDTGISTNQKSKRKKLKTPRRRNALSDGSLADDEQDYPSEKHGFKSMSNTSLSRRAAITAGSSDDGIESPAVHLEDQEFFKFSEKVDQDIMSYAFHYRKYLIRNKDHRTTRRQYNQEAFSRRLGVDCTNCFTQVHRIDEFELSEKPDSHRDVALERSECPDSRRPSSEVMSKLTWDDSGILSWVMLSPSDGPLPTTDIQCSERRRVRPELESTPRSTPVSFVSAVDTKPLSENLSPLVKTPCRLLRLENAKDSQRRRFICDVQGRNSMSFDQDDLYSDVVNSHRLQWESDNSSLMCRDQKVLVYRRRSHSMPDIGPTPSLPDDTEFYGRRNHSVGCLEEFEPAPCPNILRSGAGLIHPATKISLVSLNKSLTSEDLAPNWEYSQGNEPVICPLTKEYLALHNERIYQLDKEASVYSSSSLYNLSKPGTGNFTRATFSHCINVNRPSDSSTSTAEDICIDIEPQLHSEPTPRTPELTVRVAPRNQERGRGDRQRIKLIIRCIAIMIVLFIILLGVITITGS